MASALPNVRKSEPRVQLESVRILSDSGYRNLRKCVGAGLVPTPAATSIAAPDLPGRGNLMPTGSSFDTVVPRNDGGGMSF